MVAWVSATACGRRHRTVEKWDALVGYGDRGRSLGGIAFTRRVKNTPCSWLRTCVRSKPNNAAAWPGRVGRIRNHRSVSS